MKARSVSSWRTTGSRKRSCTRGGSSRILVYQSRYAGTNKATAATWVIEDGMERVVQALKAKGVTFEHYDMPE